VKRRASESAAASGNGVASGERASVCEAREGSSDEFQRFLVARALLTKYIATLPLHQHTTQATFTDDVLYGLGLALSTPDQQFRFADGYTLFKATLRAHLDSSA